MRSLMRAVTLMSAMAIGLPTAAGAQAPAAADTCPGGNLPKADLGITSFSCHCSVETSGSASEWSFLTEPEIQGVSADGPSAGELQPGDRVISIDGALITTPEGGRRWSAVRPGDQVSLRVRRGGVPRTVTIVAGASCEGDVAARSGDGEPSPPELRRLLPEGWLGIGVSCDCSVDTSGDLPRWTFDGSPTIAGVMPGSPAHLAGLRAGDVLLRLDGVRLDTPAGGEAFSLIRPGQRIRFDVRRDDAELSVEVVAGRRDASE
jgi:S1-C subfamily serine protease